MNIMNPNSMTGGDDQNQFDGMSDGDLDDLALLSGEAKRRRLNDGTIVLVGAVVVAGMVLFGMRWLAGQSGKVARDGQVEKQVDEFLAALPVSVINGSDEAEVKTGILRSLTDDRTDSQVPLDAVKKNPFESQGQRHEPPPPDPEQTRELVTTQKRAELFSKGQDKVARMEISSIMGSPGRFVAVLDGNVVQVGDEFKGFTIAAISQFDVTLQEHVNTVASGFPLEFDFTYTKSLND